MKKDNVVMLKTIDASELAVRLFECAANLKRKPGQTARDALDGIPEPARSMFVAQAKVACEYLGEVLKEISGGKISSSIA